MSLSETGRVVALCDRIIAVASEVRRQAAADELDTSLVPADCLAAIARRCECDESVSSAALVSRAVTFYIRNVMNVEPVSDRVRDAVLRGVGIEQPRRGLAGADEERWCLTR